MKESWKRIEILYFTAFFLLCFSVNVYNGSYISWIVPTIVNTVIKYLAMLLFMLVITEEHWTKEHCFFSMGAILLVGLVSMVIDKPVLILYILAIVASRVTNMEKIKKVYVNTHLLGIFCVLGSCAMGWIPDVTYDHGNEIAHCLGYYYYSNLSTIILFVSLADLMRERKHFCSYGRMLFWFLINWMVYEVATTRLTFLIFLFAFFMILVLEKWKLLKLKDNWFYRTAATWMFPAAMACCMILSLWFEKGYGWIIKINKILSSRIFFNCEGLKRYGASFFGTRFPMYGRTDIYHGVVKGIKYFYIDSGYIYTFLAYGIIVCVMILAAYSLLSRYAVRKKDTMLLIWCMTICIHSVVNDVMIKVDVNPILLMLPVVWKDLSQRRRIRWK